MLILRGEAAYQQSGPTTSDLAERFTGPSRECMEWLGEMGPSAYDVYSCILVVCRLRIQSSRERSEVEHFRELACTAVCEPGGRRYILGCAAGSFIGQ